MKLKQVLTASFLTGAIAIGGSALAAPTTAPTATPLAAQNQTSFTPQQVKEIQKVVHDYLVNNPQVLVEASQALQKRSQVQQQQVAMQAIKQNAKQLFNDPSNPVAGNPNGTVTVIEFFDYQCGHCKSMNTTIKNIIAKNPNLRVVFKELPIFGGASQFAAKAAIASMKQGKNKYFTFHEALLSADNPLTQKKVFQVAQSVGLKVPQLKKDMNDPAIQQQLRTNFKLAQAIKLIGTPTFVIGNKAETKFRFIPGATSQQNMQQLIDQVAQ